MKRASYRYGVEWIALNDEPDDLDAESVSTYISTSLLAELFGKDALDVGEAIVRYRRKHAIGGEFDGWLSTDAVNALVSQLVPEDDNNNTKESN